MTTHYDLCIIDRSFIYSQHSKSIDGLNDRRQNNNKKKKWNKTYQSVKFNLWASKYTKYIHNKKLQLDWFEVFKIKKC